MEEKKTHLALKALKVISIAIAGMFIVAGIFYMPIFLTQPSKTILGFPTPDFRGMGEIGDTIGGITAPFIGIIAAILVYISFRAQIKANKELMELNEKTLFFDAFGNYKKYFEEIEINMEELKFNIKTGWLPKDPSSALIQNVSGAIAIRSFSELRYEIYSKDELREFLTKLLGNLNELIGLMERFYKLDPNGKYRHTIPHVLSPKYKGAIYRFASKDNAFFDGLEDKEFIKVMYIECKSAMIRITDLIDKKPE